MLIIAQLCLKVIVWIIRIVERNNWKFFTYWFWCQNPTVLEARGLLGRECTPCDSYVKVGQLIMNIMSLAHTIHLFINLCLKETMQHLKCIFTHSLNFLIQCSGFNDAVRFVFSCIPAMLSSEEFHPETEPTLRLCCFQAEDSIWVICPLRYNSVFGEIPYVHDTNCFIL